MLRSGGLIFIMGVKQCGREWQGRWLCFVKRGEVLISDESLSVKTKGFIVLPA